MNFVQNAIKKRFKINRSNIPLDHGSTWLPAMLATIYWNKVNIYIYVHCCIGPVHIYIYMCVYMCVCMYVCLYVCLFVCLYVRMYVCMDVSMYVCIYVCLYVCMFVLYIHTNKSIYIFVCVAMNFVY